MKPRPSKKSKLRRTQEGERPSKSRPGDFPIAAIGASAGGLEAFTELIRHVPTDVGMAFVLIQHLDPKHHSLLTELVARETPMPVVEVKAGMIVEPNHVYVIPANATMSVSDHTLQLAPRDRGQHMVVDYFMRSLAEAQGSRAVGVILSGTGSDGTLGMAEIQAQGGVTFAQDEQSAKYDGMPRSAVAAGCVDFVLPTRTIARELARIARHAYVKHERLAEGVENVPDAHLGLNTILQHLRKSESVDFTYYRQTTIRRRIQRRMVVHKMDKLEDYVKYMQQNPAEAKALYQDLLINVTSFFRNARVFQALKKTVFPALAKGHKPDTPIRIWVPGCASGEETYSLAISLLESLGDKAAHIPIQLFGTDVSETSIAKARTGYYPENIQVDVSPERLHRFFLKVEGGYRLTRNIRDMCIFAQHNLLNDPPFSQMDLICCRNLLIYLEPVLQRKVISLFHYALRSIGFLVLGTSEGTGTSTNLFTQEDRIQKIYSKKATGVRPAVSFALTRHFERMDRGTPSQGPAKQADTSWNYLEAQKEFDRRLLTQFGPAAVFINEDLDVIHSRGNVDRYLKLAPGRASLSLLKMAREGLLLDLRNAVTRAKKENTTVRKLNVQVKGAEREVNFEVSPVTVANLKEPYFMVVFTEGAPKAARRARKRSLSKGVAEESEAATRRITKVEQELAATKEYLQSVIENQEATNEELQSANEEILSSNEELQSTNEELETAKEELQSSNEELTTVNDELRNRNLEITQANNDLTNLLASVNIAMVMLANDLTIRRFTPQAQKVLGLIPSDIGRPLTNINLNIDVPDLQAMISQVIETFGTIEKIEKEVRHRSGPWYLLRILPYRISEKKIEGVVITLLDILGTKRMEQALRQDLGEPLTHPTELVENAGQSILVLDASLEVKTADAAFYHAFQLAPQETENRPLQQLPRGPWNNLALIKALEDCLRSNTHLSNFELEHEFPQTGRRKLRFHTTSVDSDGGSRLLVLSIEDLTARQELGNALTEQSTVLGLVNDSIVIWDVNNRIRFWNRSAGTLYGWEAREVIGKNLHELLKTKFPVSAEDADSKVVRENQWEGELEQTARDGKKVIVLSRWSLLRENGRPYAVVGVHREIDATESEGKVRSRREQRNVRSSSQAGGA